MVAKANLAAESEHILIVTFGL